MSKYICTLCTHRELGKCTNIMLCFMYSINQICCNISSDSDYKIISLMISESRGHGQSQLFLLLGLNFRYHVFGLCQFHDLTVFNSQQLACMLIPYISAYDVSYLGFLCGRGYLISTASISHCVSDMLDFLTLFRYWLFTSVFVTIYIIFDSILSSANGLMQLYHNWADCIVVASYGYDTTSLTRTVVVAVLALIFLKAQKIGFGLLWNRTMGPELRIS